MMGTLVAAGLLLIHASIVRRADQPDTRYLELGARFPAVVALGRAGDATLIAPRWLLTAAHVAHAVRDGRVSVVSIGNHEYGIDRVVTHPAWSERQEHDVGLIRLTRAVTGVRPMPLYRGTRERARILTLVGHGGAGTGDLRSRAEDGRVRGATSRVDSLNASWLYFSFDAPPGGTAMEGAPGPGDSGGPAVIKVHGRFAVAGVSSAAFDGRNGAGSYGAVDLFTRVTTHAAWIDSVMRAPPPAAVGPKPDSALALPPGRQPVSLPDTPVGKRYAAFLQAMRAGTDSAILGFLEANFDPRELESRSARDRLPNFRRLAQALGAATIQAIERSEPLRLSARLNSAAGALTLELICAPEPPHGIVDWRRYDDR